MSQQTFKRKDLVNAIKSFGGNLRGNWATATTLFSNLIIHYDENSKDSELILKLYNECTTSDSPTMAEAIKRASSFLRNIRIETKDGVTTARTGKAKNLDQKEIDEWAEKLTRESGDGLRAFIKPKSSKTGSRGKDGNDPTKTLDGKYAVTANDLKEACQKIEAINAEDAVLLNIYAQLEGLKSQLTTHLKTLNENMDSAGKASGIVDNDKNNAQNDSAVSEEDKVA